VRELDNVLKAAVAGAVGRGIRTLGPELLANPGASPPPEQGPVEVRAAVVASSDAFELVGPDHREVLPDHLLTAVEQVQRALIQDALRRSNGNRPKAAERLGVSRQWLHTLLTRWAEAGRQA
jgi:DNA-binding NtrC family response regulator